jgi:hypothetical protein
MISVEVFQVPSDGRSWRGSIDKISPESFAVALFAAVVEGVDFRKDCEIVINPCKNPVFASSDFRQQFLEARDICKDRSLA